MKFFTNKGVIQKTILAIVIVILTTFCVPSTVQADIGGKLMSPIVNFVVGIFDGIQRILIDAMIGESPNFMKDIVEGISLDNILNMDWENLGKINYPTSANSGVSITTDEFIDSTFFGLNIVQVPVIRYTPEEIFSNKVPALEVNFIKPSNSSTDDKNIANKLRPTIASWYVALRSIAVVGLLSVLVYLGIRMLLTSVAADRAKYKQMLLDWLVAICLVLIMHYIMSFVLTMIETVSAMISSEGNTTFTVHATNVDVLVGTVQVDFGANLMSYVRFMVQAGDLQIKVGFLMLYIMLVIYSIRFTWVYLKRVVNMAFLTLIAPMVALTYPIDKVSDGKAQAFNMWLKEFIYNALIQPIHLLLYRVLLGTSIELAADNPIYAIVALGFIIAAEKLVKQMFGFGKASGGTVGSLAGAAGVTAIAGKALQSFAKKGPNQQGKVRTKDIPERQGRDAQSNKPFEAFKGKDANNVIGGGSDTPPLPSPDEGTPPPGGDAPSPGGDAPSPEGENGLPRPEEMEQLDKELEGYTNEEIMMDPELRAKQERYQDLYDQENAKQQEEVQQQQINQQEYDNPFARPEDAPKELNIWDMMKQDTGNYFQRSGERLNAARDAWNNLKTPEGKRQLKNRIGSEINKRAIGAWKTLPTVGYKAARGTLKMASRGVLAAAMGTVGLAIGATTGDGEKALSMAFGAGAVGAVTGGNLFEATAGKKMRDKSILDTYEAGKYGNIIDARNARADKAYFQSEKFDNFYEKYYKGKKDASTGKDYTKKDVQKFVQDYRKAGITDHTDIRRARALEDKYVKETKGLSRKDARAQVQNIVQSYEPMGIDKKAYSDANMRAAEINRIAGMLGGDPKSANNQQVAKQLFQGFVDWRNSAV